MSLLVAVEWSEEHQPWNERAKGGAGSSKRTAPFLQNLVTPLAVHKDQWRHLWDQ